MGLGDKKNASTRARLSLSLMYVLLSANLLDASVEFIII